MKPEYCKMEWESWTVKKDALLESFLFFYLGAKLIHYLLESDFIIIHKSCQGLLLELGAEVV